MRLLDMKEIVPRMIAEEKVEVTRGSETGQVRCPLIRTHFHGFPVNNERKPTTAERRRQRDTGNDSKGGPARQHQGRV